MVTELPEHGHCLSDEEWQQIVALVLRWRSLAQQLSDVYGAFESANSDAYRGAVELAATADKILEILGYRAEAAR